MLAYVLVNMYEDLPTFIVMNAVRSNTRTPIQAMSARMWSSGFLPAKYAGVSLRAGAEPVLFINNPDGVSPEVRRRMLDGLNALNTLQHETVGDPETVAMLIASSRRAGGPVDRRSAR